MVCIYIDIDDLSDLIGLEILGVVVLAALVDPSLFCPHYEQVLRHLVQVHARPSCHTYSQSEGASMGASERER